MKIAVIGGTGLIEEKSNSRNAVSNSIRAHNETLSVVAVCVGNPDLASVRIQR